MSYRCGLVSSPRGPHHSHLFITFLPIRHLHQREQCRPYLATGSLGRQVDIVAIPASAQHRPRTPRACPTPARLREPGGVRPSGRTVRRCMLRTAPSGSTFALSVKLFRNTVRKGNRSTAYLQGEEASFRGARWHQVRGRGQWHLWRVSDRGLSIFS